MFPDSVRFSVIYTTVNKHIWDYMTFFLYYAAFENGCLFLEWPQSQKESDLQYIHITCSFVYVWASGMWNDMMPAFCVWNINW